MAAHVDPNGPEEPGERRILDVSSARSVEHRENRCCGSATAGGGWMIAMTRRRRVGVQWRHDRSELSA
jgi:hypothetical protein